MIIVEEFIAGNIKSNDLKEIINKIILNSSKGILEFDKEMKVFFENRTGWEIHSTHHLGKYVNMGTKTTLLVYDSDDSASKFR
ncbi:MAG: hypothetical protein ACYDBP_04200 [Leptospirales bacterium]